jgi:hypothetical protein
MSPGEARNTALPLGDVFAVLQQPVDRILGRGSRLSGSVVSIKSSQKMEKIVAGLLLKVLNYGIK